MIIQTKKKYIAFTIILAIAYWCIDSLIDSHLFNKPFIQSLFQPSLHELVMRSTALVFLLSLMWITRIMINKKKQAQRTSNHLNQVLRAIRNINQLITQENDRDRLIEKSCHLLTETRGYKGAIMILLNEQGQFTKLEAAGWDVKRKKEMQALLEQGLFVECFHRALDQKGVVLIEDTQTVCQGCPILEEDINNRSLTCRIEHDGRIFGVMAVNLPKQFAPLEAEQELVKEVADDLAFALHNIEVSNKLCERDQHYRLLAETASDIICIHDLDGKIQYLNSSGLKALGKSQEEMKGTSITEFIQQNEELKSRRSQRTEGDASKYTYQTHFINPLGHHVPVEINSSPIIKNGVTTGVLIVARDITERRQAEESIQSHLNNLQIIYEVTSSLNKAESENEILDIIGSRVQMLNPEAYIIPSAIDENDPDLMYINNYYGPQEHFKEAIKTLGRDPKTIPIRISEMREENRSSLESGKFKTMQGGLFKLLSRKIPEHLCRKTEEYLMIENIYSMGFYYKGSIGGAIIILLKEGLYLNNQTLLENIINQASVSLSQKQSETSLKIAKGMAEESDRLKSAFLMNLSHEVRTPLNGIMGFSQILQEREFSFDKRKEFLNIIYDKAGQLLQILNDILDLSKIESDQMKIGKDDFYLNDIFHELYDTFNLYLEKQKLTSIHLSYTCQLTRDETRLYTDRSRLSQILRNLISNAIKFTEEGSVAFGYRYQEPHNLLFFVQDTGIGIAPEKQEEIFKPFRQADETTSRDYEGTGLGLSISQSLVKIFGGQVWIESEVNKGSTFYFTIPFSKHKYHQNQEPATPKRSSYSWSGQKVLIVEDDPVSLEFMKEILDGTNAQIITAKNGKEGLQRFQKNKGISLILMDVRLPDISGLDVVKKIRTTNSNIPIIAQTAYTMDQNAKKCQEAGCNDYLTKPIDIKTMMKLMNKYFK